MAFDPIPILFVILFLSFVIGWILLFNRRVEPWLRERIGRKLGVRINRRIRFRSSGWEAVGATRPSTGCLVTFWEVVIEFGLGVGPIFLALLVMGLALFAIYD